MAITGISAMIPQAKRAKAAKYFLAYKRKPSSGYTDSEWLDFCVEEYLKKCIKKGKERADLKAQEEFEPFE